MLGNFSWVVLISFKIIFLLPTITSSPSVILTSYSFLKTLEQVIPLAIPTPI